MKGEYGKKGVGDQLCGKSIDELTWRDPEDHHISAWTGGDLMA